MDSVPARDKPWVMRTYSGHSSARASNELYRRNLAKGQTGLSVAFDLPTQTGYDPDHILARGEVGKVGVPVPHLGEMRALFDEIPIEDMNTSMTINATCAWLLGHVRGPGPGAGRRPGAAVGHDPERHHEGVPVPGDVHLPARARPAGSRSTPSPTRWPTSPSGTRSTSARTTSRRRGRRPSRRWPTPWPPLVPCSTPFVNRARSSPTASPRWWAGSRSSSTPASGSSKRSASSGPWAACGTGSAGSATA